MYSRLTLLFFVLIMLNVTGCTTYSQARKQLAESIPESERAYLIGKFSVQCRPNRGGTQCNQAFNSIFVNYKSIGELDFLDRLNSTQGDMFGDGTQYDIIDIENQTKSYYFCRILPEGSYSLFTLRYWNFAGGGSGYYLKEEDYFDIAFSLTKQKISLIGSLKMTTDQGKNIFGMALPIPGFLELGDLHDEEIKAALQKCPESVRHYEIIQQNLTGKSYQSPFIRTQN